MSEATRIYRNPDAPLGYTLPETTKRHDDVNNIAFLLDVLECIHSDSEVDSDIDKFVIFTSEESSDDDVQIEDQIDAADTRKSPVDVEAIVPTIDKTGAKKNDAGASSSSAKIASPVRPEEKKRATKPDKSPKLKSKTSAERRERRDSGSNSDSSHYSRSKPRGYSRSASPVRIKQEQIPEHLFGCYHCDVCNITLSSKVTYDSHVIGKRHKKACNKVLNIVDTVARSIPATEVECKKPMPAPGIVRVRVKEDAHIQKLAEDTIKTPLPGLHYVVEIRAFSETSYYCSLCNAPCSGNSILPHLGGFKHMLKCLKMFRPDVYDQISYKQKYQIEDKVKKILRAVEQQEGRGKITVEEDKFSVESGGDEYGPRSTSVRPQPGPSHAEYRDFNEYFDQTTIPDTSKSGYYCRLCESHMNSYDMWQNHVSGKRHIANARKMPGSIPSKIKNIPMKDVRPNLMDLLEGIRTPVVGLDHVRETQSRLTRKDMYQCYLCGACLNTNDVVEHVTSHKHRVKYLSEATKIYRNPDAPLGYTLQEKTNTQNEVNNIVFLLNVLEGIHSDSEVDSDIDHFRPFSSEESAEEDVQNNVADERTSPIKAEAIPTEEIGAKRNDAVASSSSSRKVSPVKSEKKKRATKSDKSPKKSRTGAERRKRHDSDSSSDSGHVARPRPRRRSRSASPVRIKLEPVPIKQEAIPQHLFGCYHCSVCNITLNSKATYDCHVIGRRHMKACNKANIVDTVARSVPATEVESKKPKPAPGIVRVRVKETAYIQKMIDDTIRIPIPGLHHVTEIRGFSETSYYCSLCNAPCSGNSILPHLGGFKHSLMCVKHYRPKVYDQNCYKQKYQIEDRIREILQTIEEQEGRGLVTVEEEKVVVESGGDQYGSRSTSVRPQPSTSSQTQYMDFEEYYDQTTIPDTSVSGYYCRLCQSHMNSYDMWQNHISGKRHIANCRKMPGSAPSKLKKIHMPDVRANLMDLLEGVETPVVGLNHIQETQSHPTRTDSYQCLLCSGSHNTNDIVEHVISHKHRVKFLQDIRHACLAVVKDMDVNGPNACAIVEDACAGVEAERGPGIVRVYFTKDSFPHGVIG